MSFAAVRRVLAEEDTETAAYVATVVEHDKSNILSCYHSSEQMRNLAGRIIVALIFSSALGGAEFLTVIRDLDLVTLYPLGGVSTALGHNTSNRLAIAKVQHYPLICSVVTGAPTALRIEVRQTTRTPLPEHMIIPHTRGRNALVTGDVCDWVCSTWPCAKCRACASGNCRHFAFLQSATPNL